MHCGQLGPGFASPVITDRGKAKKGKDRWVNWKSCQYLKVRITEGPDGKSVYPVCSKGHIVERVAGAALGRLFRGKPAKCHDFEEIPSIVKPPVVEREDLEAVGMSKHEMEVIVGPMIIV